MAMFNCYVSSPEGRGGSTQPWWAKMELYATKIWIPATVAGRPKKELQCVDEMCYTYTVYCHSLYVCIYIYMQDHE